MIARRGLNGQNAPCPFEGGGGGGLGARRGAGGERRLASGQRVGVLCA
jgi:hypothetical protein